MEFTVGEFISQSELGDLELICGEGGLNNSIKGVTIIEAPDIVKFISGGEVLLTGFYAFRSCSPEEFRKYLSELDHKKASAVLFKRGRKVEQATEKREILKQYCNSNDIPMIEVPFEVSFQKIMSNIMERLFNKEVTMLKYFRSTHDNFSAVSFRQRSEKAMTEDILDMLEKLIRNPVALYDEYFSCIGTSDKKYSEFKPGQPLEKYDPGLVSSRIYTIQNHKDGYREIYSRISMFQNLSVYIVVSETDSRFGLMDSIAIENAVDSLSHEFSKYQAVSNLKEQYHNDIINNLLLGKTENTSDFKRESTLLGMDTEALYTVICIGVSGIKEDFSGYGQRKKYFEYIHKRMKETFKGICIYKNTHNLTVIQPLGEYEKPEHFRTETEKFMEAIESELKKTDKKIEVHAGAGKKVVGLKRISESYKQAEETLSFLEDAGLSALRGNGRVMFFEDLGIFKLIEKVESIEEMKEFVPEALKKLYNYKKPQRDDLIDTLRTYLNHNNNLTKTSQDLFVHYKTASYRLERIISITGINFDNPNEVLSFRIGLIVIQMIEARFRKTSGPNDVLTM